MMTVTRFAPAKINLALHVTGRRADGYHELDSLVMFANIGDTVTVKPAAKTSLQVTGPMADRLPHTPDNLVLKAGQLAGIPAQITLDKHLPIAAGLGGGSSNVAAVWSALSELSNRDLKGDVDMLGADVPVCRVGRTARMQGIGDKVSPLDGLPTLHAVLVNPNLPVMTAEVFRKLDKTDNAPLPAEIPQDMDAEQFTNWLGEMRNDLEAPAIEAEPVIEQVFAALSVTPGCQLTRMSGSGGTCFGIYRDAERAASAAGRLKESNPGWWVSAVHLNPKAA